MVSTSCKTMHHQSFFHCIAARFPCLGSFSLMLIVLLFDLVFDTVFILFIYLTLRGGGSLMSYIFRLMSYIFCIMSYIYIQSENVIFTQHK